MKFLSKITKHYEVNAEILLEKGYKPSPRYEIVDLNGKVHGVINSKDEESALKGFYAMFPAKRNLNLKAVLKPRPLK